MPQWKDLLIEVEKIEVKYGSSLKKPALGTEIIKMIETIQDNLGHIVLPESYIEFLKKINGLDFNGLVIYGVDGVHGFIETNEIWYENDWQKKYVFFGDSDTAWYCFDLKVGVYVDLDKPSGTVIQSFESFDFMLKEALEKILL
ncbi:SMI1/KNR4 family protein [Sporosarcina sp. Marseille-Q4063]|uniref:YrhA family protein n=1 Tax=Sporosarcina sp. Marseille-Q4063 TaxID=2810514 RepID=UPI001BB0D2B7|nr:YrhA family protein [Sporosarcina sp. Marseille-Q4063]QUW23027.1 SMI1/KNR4 family protein [Sporosarcina sp. Marseille-Q4063]